MNRRKFGKFIAGLGALTSIGFANQSLAQGSKKHKVPAKFSDRENPAREYFINDKKVDKNTYENLMGSYCDKTGFWERNSEASKWTFTIKEPYHVR